MTCPKYTQLQSSRILFQPRLQTPNHRLLSMAQVSRLINRAGKSYWWDVRNSCKTDWGQRWRLGNSCHIQLAEASSMEDAQGVCVSGQRSQGGPDRERAEERHPHRASKGRERTSQWSILPAKMCRVGMDQESKCHRNFRATGQRGHQSHRERQNLVEF